jgi:hypothetical protein
VPLLRLLPAGPVLPCAALLLLLAALTPTLLLIKACSIVRKPTTYLVTCSGGPAMDARTLHQHQLCPLECRTIQMMYCPRHMSAQETTSI